MRSWTVALLLCAAGVARAAAAEQTQPQRAVAERARPQWAVVERARQQRAVAEQTQPQRAVAELTQPQRAVGEQTRPQRAVGEQTRPARAVREQTRPARAVGEQARPARAVEEQAQPTPSLSDSAERWQQLIADITSRTWAAGGAGVAWYSPPMQVPLQGDSSSRTSMSVLVVPVPVSVPGTAPVPVPGVAPRADSAQCLLSAPPEPAPTAPTAPTAPPSSVYANVAYPPLNQPTLLNLFPGYNQVPGYSTIPGSYTVKQYNPVPAPAPLPNYEARPSSPVTPPAPPSPSRPTSPFPPAGGSPQRRPDADERIARNAPNFPPVENSQLLVQQFREQEPTDPTLPPIVLDPIDTVSTSDYTVEELKAQDSPAVGAEGGAEAGAGRVRRRLRCKRRPAGPAGPDGPDGAEPAPPPPPRWERSLYLRARLTVPRADYTEPYAVWWDAASGAARVDFHGGVSSSYRMIMRDGRVMSAQIRADRTGSADVRRCSVTAPRRAPLAERAPPALPDLTRFSFAGYVLRGQQRAERWRYTLSGHRGELGAARDEALTFRHELLLTRAADNRTATPLWYSVRVDSSVLGADCDGYVHYFDEVQLRQHDPSMFRLDIADACEQVEYTDRMETVEPLREFTMLGRDPRHDAELDQFKRKFQRIYADSLEEAVRKNVLIQSIRHTAAGNRQGASFELTTNFLSDRLVAERRILQGAGGAAGQLGEPFPHERGQLDALRDRLPRRYDWRRRGGVTPVRSQLATCASCWAFATVGAVEGALFAVGGRLVPLSEQVLVDCAQPYGGHGCEGTWPSVAYEYVKDNGLPALDEYTPYKSAVQTCRADSVPPVTRISGFYNVTGRNILALKMAIKEYGPTVVIIDGEAQTFYTYNKGFYHDGRWRSSNNHAVLAVGWTVHRGETYFILKNSWSAAWGEGGYVYMRAPTNTCGVLNMPSVPRLRPSDVLRVPPGAPAAA